MLKNKPLDILSIVFQCIGVCGVLLYVYNYFSLTNKYGDIPEKFLSNLNIYLLIGISGILLYIIFKILLYFVSLKSIPEYNQLKFNLEDELPQNSNETYCYTENKEEDSYKVEPVEEIINESVLENNKQISYTPTNDKMVLCKNCGNVADENAFVCINCGYLLKSIDNIFESETDINIEKQDDIKYESEYTEEKRRYYSRTKNILINIIPVLLLMFLVSGIFMFVKDDIIFGKTTEVDSNKSIQFYDLAKNIIYEVEGKYNNGKIEITNNTSYFTLKDLGYKSTKYDEYKSYIAINSTDKNNVKFYISLVGGTEYENFSIDITEKGELNLTDVKINTATISSVDNKLLISNEKSVKIYYKNNL